MSAPRPGPRPGGIAPRPSLSGAPARVEGAASTPFAAEPAPPPQPDDAKGAAGRAIRRPGGAPEPPPSRSDDRGAAAPAPFAGYGPDSRLIAGAVEGSRAQSMGVLAIVGGLVFMVGSVVVVAIVALLVALFVFDAQLPGTRLAGDEIKDRHIRDTGFANPVQPEPGGGAGRAPGDPGDRTVADPNAGPPPGPATVIVPDEMMWFSIEVNCPGGYRGRGKFRPHSTKGWMKATAHNVPGDEKCTVTFQGSEPAKTYVTGNQTLQCTFNPTECHVL